MSDTPSSTSSSHQYTGKHRLIEDRVYVAMGFVSAFPVPRVWAIIYKYFLIPTIKERISSGYGDSRL